MLGGSRSISDRRPTSQSRLIHGHGLRGPVVSTGLDATGETAESSVLTSPGGSSSSAHSRPSICLSCDRASAIETAERVGLVARRLHCGENHVANPKELQRFGAGCHLAIDANSDRALIVGLRGERRRQITHADGTLDGNRCVQLVGGAVASQ
eukprot:2266534-Prymnesium_polylepis.1